MEQQCFYEILVVIFLITISWPLLTQNSEIVGGFMQNTNFHFLYHLIQCLHPFSAKMLVISTFADTLINNTYPVDIVFTSFSENKTLNYLSTGKFQNI